MSPEPRAAMSRTSAAIETERVTATAHPGSSLGLTVNNADNELIVYVNTTQVYDKKTENDPTFHDTVDLSSNLRRGQNSVVILGINWGGPAHYVGQLNLDGKPLLSMTFALPSTPNGVVAAWAAEIVVS